LFTTERERSAPKLGATLRAAADHRWHSDCRPAWQVYLAIDEVFQTVRAGCRVGRRRALRIQIRGAKGTTRQARAPALGLRWAWMLRLSRPRRSATDTSGDRTLVWVRPAANLTFAAPTARLLPFLPPRISQRPTPQLWQTLASWPRSCEELRCSGRCPHIYRDRSEADGHSHRRGSAAHRDRDASDAEAGVRKYASAVGGGPG
jgi:hypothetical protein